MANEQIGRVMPIIEIRLFPCEIKKKELSAMEITKVLEDKLGIPSLSTTVIFTKNKPE
ncbi:hypothetical protein [Bartonella apihabitans]|uniref:hypothetical protein n=1 Tax=Bartonella apihabitans TaxID=2750929 RepID=UPI0016623280|nr:hypothetical protein [Bartonella apihabitans]